MQSGQRKNCEHKLSTRERERAMTAKGKRVSIREKSRALTYSIENVLIPASPARQDDGWTSKLSKATMSGTSDLQRITPPGYNILKLD